MVEFENVTLSLGGADVLHDIDLAVPEGGLAVIFGRTGAGKSALLGLIRGEIEPSRGTIRLFGRAAPQPSDRDGVAAMRRRIGSIERAPRFLDHLTLAENVALPLVGRGTAAARPAADLDDLLAWTGLSERRSDPPARLSPAERRRAALARALAGTPDLLLADEPCAGLGRQDAEAFLRLLLEAHAAGFTLLVTTADPDLCAEIAGAAPTALLCLEDGMLEAVA